MADHSTIEWTDGTWNPVRGCTRVSEGCGGPPPPPPTACCPPGSDD